MKKFLIPLLLALSLQPSIAQKRVLIYTHNGKGYVHDNIPAAIVALTKLCKENGYHAEATDDPGIFKPGYLKNLNCIVFSSTNNEAFDTDEQKQAFVDYVHNGGGFVGIHSASGSERQWPWFSAMVGGKFVRHPELQKFTIKVIDKTHPSTSFLGDTWEFAERPST